MYDVKDVVGSVRKYLESIGIQKDLLDYELKNVSACLVLNLPQVCILKENRNSTSKQTHIHVTGEGMEFFFDKKELYEDTSKSKNDSKQDLVIFKKNLINLEIRAFEKNRIKKESKLNEENELISTFTLKKVGRIYSPSIQVQISKLRLDDRWFMHLRKCLFEGDALIFMKNSNRDSALVIGIPEDYLKYNPIRNTAVFSKTESDDDSIENIDTSMDSKLRSVDFSEIAKFDPVDEEEIEKSLMDVSLSVQKRKKRTERHQDIVKLIALDLERKGYSLFENPVDCLAIKANAKALLFEIKSLDGSGSDERNQVLKAFSQLFYYETFSVEDHKQNGIQKIVLFENKISDNHIDFFENNGITVMWLDDNKNIYGKEGIVEF